MNNFKIGDKVQRTVVSAFMDIGNIYTVSSIDNKYKRLTLKELDYNLSFESSFFRLYKSKEIIEFQNKLNNL